MSPNQPTTLLHGTPLAEALLTQVRTALASGVPAQLAIVQVGNHPASTAYVSRKVAACARVGLAVQVSPMAEEDGEATLHTLLTSLSANPTVTGILLQLPLPHGWQVQAALNHIVPTKDVDGLTTTNQTSRAIWPATPVGVLRLLDHAQINLSGQTAVVVGRSALVGAPLAQLLASRGALVHTVAKDTPDPQTITRRAHVLCVAAGAPHLITPTWIRPGASIIDIGLTRTAEGLMGDVSPAVDGTAALRTPVPGGVGPLTVASLLTNVAGAAYQQASLAKPIWQV